jgi:hypothetical protein
MNDYLISDPAERKERAADKEKYVLDFLRQEIYSTTKVLAEQMAVGERAARTTLNRMEKKGLLVKDEVKFMAGKAVPIWGITATGMMEGLTPEEVSTIKLKYHSPGRVSPVTIAHTIDVQKYRTYCELELDYREWKPTRLLPALNEKSGHPSRWAVYPDGVGLAPTKDKDKFFPIAIEVERTRKTPARYVQLIRGHLKNVQMQRYQKITYVCLTQKAADSLQALFLRLMVEKDIGLYMNEQRYTPEQSLTLFRFRSMEDLS